MRSLYIRITPPCPRVRQGSSAKRWKDAASDDGAAQGGISDPAASHLGEHYYLTIGIVNLGPAKVDDFDPSCRYSVAGLG